MRILLPVIFAILLAGVVYCSFAFAQWSFNAKDWNGQVKDFEKSVRELAAIALFVSIIVGAVLGSHIYEVTKKEKQ